MSEWQRRDHAPRKVNARMSVVKVWLDLVVKRTGPGSVGKADIMSQLKLACFELQNDFPESAFTSKTAEIVGCAFGDGFPAVDSIKTALTKAMGEKTPGRALSPERMKDTRVQAMSTMDRMWLQLWDTRTATLHPDAIFDDPRTRLQSQLGNLGSLINSSSPAAWGVIANPLTAWGSPAERPRTIQLIEAALGKWTKPTVDDGGLDDLAF